MAGGYVSGRLAPGWTGLAGEGCIRVRKKTLPATNIGNRLFNVQTIREIKIENKKLGG